MTSETRRHGRWGQSSERGLGISGLFFGKFYFGYVQFELSVFYDE